MTDEKIKKENILEILKQSYFAILNQINAEERLEIAKVAHKFKKESNES